MRGSSIIEFALIAPMFFLLCAGLIDFGRLFFVQMTVQDAVRNAARYASTGAHLPGIDPLTGQVYTRAGSVQQLIVNQAAAAGLQPTDLTILVSSVTGGAANPAGTPLDTVTITATTTMRLLTAAIAQYFGSSTYQFTVKISFKNEAFSPRCSAPPYSGC